MCLHGVLTMMLLSILATVALGQPAPTASPREAFVTANGVRLHYVDWGGTGEALLFLTPLGENSSSSSRRSPHGSRTAFASSA